MQTNPREHCKAITTRRDRVIEKGVGENLHKERERVIIETWQNQEEDQEENEKEVEEQNKEEKLVENKNKRMRKINKWWAEIEKSKERERKDEESTNEKSSVSSNSCQERQGKAVCKVSGHFQTVANLYPICRSFGTNADRLQVLEGDSYKKETVYEWGDHSFRCKM